MIFSSDKLAEIEASSLASYAVKSMESVGRKHSEKEDKDRLCFQKDMERIVHSKAFRRLDEKTQVFMSGVNDHYRTRLTHTLEVAQVSRDIARRLGLNEDLCEVIALAHDLGHPPFGHSGEAALNELMQGFDKNFEHNEQSRLIVEQLEKSYPKFEGLNLSLEVIDGLIKHQSAFDQAEMKWEVSAHLESQVVNLADEIAYTNHDMDDGLRSGIISLKDLSGFELWKQGMDSVAKKYGDSLEEEVLISRIISSVMSLMISDLCENAVANIKEFGIKTVDDVRKHKELLVCFSEEMRRKVSEIRSFLYENFYLSVDVESFNKKGQMMIKKLFKYYLDQGQNEEEVKNYIAGMTDRYLTKEYERLIIGA